jgi:hypothetical protein
LHAAVKKEAAALRFTCRTCGGEHELAEMSFGADAPLQWRLLSVDEQARSMLGDEQCEIERGEGRSFYIRGCLEIPVRHTDRTFQWGVWCSLSENSYAEVAAHWDDPLRTEIGPHFGWLCTSIPGYAETAFLKWSISDRPA